MRRASAGGRSRRALAGGQAHVFIFFSAQRGKEPSSRHKGALLSRTRGVLHTGDWSDTIDSAAARTHFQRPHTTFSYITHMSRTSAGGDELKLSSVFIVQQAAAYSRKPQELVRKSPFCGLIGLLGTKYRGSSHPIVIKHHKKSLDPAHAYIIPRFLSNQRR